MSKENPFDVSESTLKEIRELQNRKGGGMSDKDSKGELKPPPRIYLQWFCEEGEGPRKLESHEITWCHDKIYDDDLCYIRAGKPRPITPKEEWISVKREDLEKMISNLESGYKFISDQLGTEQSVEKWICSMNEKYLPSPPTKDQTEKDTNVQA